MLSVTQCYFACGDEIEKISLLLAKSRYNDEAILKICGLFIYEELDCITTSLYENVLKILTHHHKF
jgi:hypothetical protein